MNSVDLFTFSMLVASLAVPALAFLTVTVGGHVRAAIAVKKMTEVAKP